MTVSLIFCKYNLNLFRYFLETNELAKKLNELSEKSANEKVEIKIEFDGKINNIKTKFNVFEQKTDVVIKNLRADLGNNSKQNERNIEMNRKELRKSDFNFI